jgi:hypothetical protein
MKKNFFLSSLCCALVLMVTLTIVGCSDNNSKTEDIFIGKQVTLSLKGGIDQLKGKVIDLKVNEYMTMEDENYIFTINLNNREYRIVMEKEMSE